MDDKDKREEEKYYHWNVHMAKASLSILDWTYDQKGCPPTYEQPTLSNVKGPEATPLQLWALSKETDTCMEEIIQLCLVEDTRQYGKPWMQWIDTIKKAMEQSLS